MNKIISLILGLSLLFSFSAMVQAENVNTLIDKAQKSYEKSEYQVAAQNFIRAQVDKPEDAKLKYNIGNAKYRLSDFTKAIESYTSALKDKANSLLKSKIHYNLGNTLYKKGDKKKALTQYLEALRENPNDLQAKQNYEFLLNQMKPPPPCKNCNKKDKKKDKKDQKGNNKNKNQSKDKKNKDKKNKDKNKKDKDKKKKDKDKKDKQNKGCSNCNKDKQNKGKKDQNKNKKKQNKNEKDPNKAKKDQNKNNNQQNQNQNTNNNRQQNQLFSYDQISKVEQEHQKLRRQQAEQILMQLQEKRIDPPRKVLQGRYSSNKDW